MPPSHSSEAYSDLRRGVDDACLLATEHQLHLASILGPQPKWRLNPADGTAEFITRNGTIITATVHPIGVMDRGTWTWAWADERISTERCAAASQAHLLGLEKQMTILTRPQYPLTSQYTRVTPEQIMACTKIIHRIWRHFIFDMPGGARMYAAINLPHLQLPPPAANRLLQTARKTQELLPITRPRRALASYAALRGLTRQDNSTRTSMRLYLPDGAVEFAWTEEKLVGHRLAEPAYTPRCENDPHEAHDDYREERPGRHRKVAQQSTSRGDGPAQ